MQHPHLNNEQLHEIHQLLLNFAYNQVQNHELAEDLVQETLIKTLIHQDKFYGKSTYKTWVFSILKNIITDHFRHKQTVSFSDLHRENEHQDDLLERLFDETGHWQEGCSLLPLPEPDQVYEKEAFFIVLEQCLERLPAEQARVFLMREYLEMDTTTICQESGISESKFYVLMHRARLRLQNCLGNYWFTQQG